MTGDGRADVVVGSGPGMQSKVKVYDSSTRRAAVSVSPFARPFLGGVSVAAADVNRDKRADVIVGSGPGIKSTVAVFDRTTRWPRLFNPIRGGCIRRHAPAELTPATPLAKALRLMVRKKYGCLPVVDKKGKLVGIVTETDATRLAARLVRELDIPWPSPVD